ncbi:hypothetical protein [Flammeovirga sp. SJP92]|uniref:hypothetical protein n=1 Tax=Flammeovirga sp. SJP92 TaxID=1775430 RepID=UPI000786E6BD|nr:hypothetical protein [Flammeovirga sp. SJP92]KXX69389.1 hypothetical protein AVL50_19555 [Flammeovirga sp. SJP92]
MKFIFKHANGKNLNLLFFAFLSSYLFLNTGQHPFSIPSVIQQSDGFAILNVVPYYDAETAYVFLNAYTSSAIEIYYRILCFDFLVLIPLYVSFFSMSLIFLLQRLSHLKNDVLQKIALLPFIAGILNIAEDLIIVFLLYDFPNQWLVIATISGLLTASKSMVTVICLLGVFGLYLVWGMKKIFKNKHFF